MTEPSVQSEIESLRAAISQERETRIAEKIDRLEQTVKDMQVGMKELAAFSGDFGEIKTTVNQALEEAKSSNKNMPPIQSTVAAVLIVIGLLGWQLKDVLEAKDKLTDLSEPVANAALALEKSTKASNDLVGSVKEQLTSLQLALDQNRELLAEYNRNISGSTQMVSGFEEKLLKLSMQVTLLTERISKNSVGVDSPSLSSPNEPSSILEALASRVAGSGHPVAMLAQASVELNKGNYKRARTLALDAKLRHSGDPENAYDIIIAQSYHKEGRYQDAIGAWQKAAETADEEGLISVLSNMGASYHAWARSVSDDEPRKIALMEKAAEIEGRVRGLTSTEPAVYANGAVTLNDLGRNADALGVLKEYKGKESDQIQYALANTYALLGRNSASLDALGSALRLNNELALQAGLDEDFSVLRSDPEFEQILSTYLPEQLIEAIRESWRDDS